MEKWLAEGKTIWVLCQLGIGILVATKIGIGWTILLEIVAVFLIAGAVEVWQPKLPNGYRPTDAARYESIDASSREFWGMVRSKRHTKAQLNKKAYDILDHYGDLLVRDDPHRVRGLW